MNSSKPYLIRALYEWIIDNGCTPHITVNINFPRVDVPRNYAIDEWITLDISTTATQHLLIDNKAITAKARFGGVVHNLYIPIGSVEAIYAQETKHGMNFPREEYQKEKMSEEDIYDKTPISSKPHDGKPKFHIIKGGKD